MGARSVPRQASTVGGEDLVTQATAPADSGFMESNDARGRSFSPSRAMGARSASISRTLEQASEGGEEGVRGRA